MTIAFSGPRSLDKLKASNRSGQTQKYPYSCLPFVPVHTDGRTIPDDFYRIGSVAALTGIAVERLRAWERRHGFSPAHKSGRTRFYSADQLEKLKKIKHLIDRGQTVSSVINLSESQLHQRLTDQAA